MASLCCNGPRSAFVAALLFIGATTAHAGEPCANPLARLVVANGNVELLRQGTTRLVVADVDASLCAGDTVVVHQRSQAALLLSNATAIRLDQGTTISLSPAVGERPPLLNIVSGAIYVISRTPRPFRIKTPFINANVEGTEFLVEVRRRSDEAADAACAPGSPSPARVDSDRVSVYEGRVQVSGDQPGAAPLLLAAGETAVATATQGPSKELVLRPRDAVVWTLYVPAILPSERSLTPVNACAGRLLAQGKLIEARTTLRSSLPADPAASSFGDSLAYALLATVAVAENERDQAREYAELATRLDPSSAPAWAARSYEQQARFQIADALGSAQKADSLSPSATHKARVAELQLAIGNAELALAAASAATAADPNLARAQTVIGFVHLARIETGRAMEAFRRAIAIDAADPLSRLGLGLAKIRAGDLPGGRQEIEVAAVLDTESSLVRSYLGKAYYEEKRDRLAQTQLALAKTFDPKDPTPWFYQAILDQSGNRPVDSLESLQKSIALNDNRAVYRSRLLLDQDQAARSIALARTYRMLGFDQLALLESVKSLSLDPSDSSAHRFLADSYSGQIRSEAARSSELLQAQLRQPLAVNTITPVLLTDRRQLVEGGGAVQASSREFTPLFNRNQVVARTDALVGNQHTFGDQVFVSGLHDSIAFSGGQSHYETRGLRPNNDMRRDVYDAFVQVGLSPALRIQAELRDDRTRQGDLAFRFDPDDFSRNLRDEFQQRTARIGGIFVIDPASNVVVSAISGRGKERFFSKADPAGGVEDRERLNAAEVQYVLKGPSFHLTTGLSGYTNKVALEDSIGILNEDEKGRSIYASVVLTALPWGLRPDLGLSVDTFEQAGLRVSRTDPKLGLLWTLSPDTTLRAAYFKTIKRSFGANQTLQPSQIFGFNQYFDDLNGTLSRGTGIALQHRLSASTFTGAEWSSRNSQVPGFPGDPYSKWTERLARAYLYGVLDANTAMTAEWQYELLRRPEDNPGNEAFTKVRTMLVPVALRFNWPLSWSAALQLTYVDQKVQTVSLAGDLVDGSDKFAVADASVSYQLPGRNGFLSLEAKNLFDRRFLYQEIDSFSSPRVSPRRTVFLRFSASF